MAKSLAFVFLLLFSFSCWGQAQSKNKIRNLELRVFFPAESLSLDPVYEPYIKSYSEILRQNSYFHIIILHKDESYESQARALKIFEAFVRKYKVSPSKVFIRAGLPPSYKSKAGEKVVVFFKRDRSPRQRLRPSQSLVKKIEQKKKANYIYIRGTVREKKLKRFGALSFANYNFSNTDKDVSALRFAGGLRYKQFDALYFVAGVDLSHSGSSLTRAPEQNYSLGFESRFSNWSSNTRLYGRQNWMWDEAEQRFETAYDLGFHQGLDFNLYKSRDHLLKLGLWAELSLSNNISELRSANVLSFQSEIKFVWRDPNLFINLHHTLREADVFNVNILGLSLGYYF